MRLACVCVYVGPGGPVEPLRQMTQQTWPRHSLMLIEPGNESQ